MKLEDISHWFQIAASFGVVFGLSLVYWEIRQSYDITQAQLIDGVYSMMTEQNTASYGEQLHLIFEKACVSPDQLTTSDLFVLDAYFFDIINRLRRNITINDATGFYEDEPWRLYTGNISGILRTHAGRYWWQRSRSWLEPDLVEVGDEIYSALGETDCGEREAGYYKYLNSVQN